MLTVSFHSYKGGSCRTSTCYNTLPFLAKQLGATATCPLLVIDADLESQGLTYLFESEMFFRDKPYDAKELFSGKNLGNYRENCIPVGGKLGLENESVYFLGVNDAKSFVAQNVGGQVERVLNNLTAGNFCGIVYDTAAGDQVSATATNKASQVIVCCMRPTKQFRTGTFSFLGRVGGKWILQGGEQIRRVVILPTAVPKENTIIENVEQKKNAREKIHSQIDRLGWEICEDFVQEDTFGIPEVERFKWCEDVLYRLNKSGMINAEADAKTALDRYEKLATTIIREAELVED